MISVVTLYLIRKTSPLIWVKNIYNHKIITHIYIVVVRILSEI